MSIQYLDTVDTSLEGDAGMAKPRVDVTEMLRWMFDAQLNDIELAAILTERVGRSISPRQVFRWKRGLSVPRPAYALELEKLSNGRINGKTFMSDFRGDPPKKDDPPDGGGSS